MKLRVLYHSICNVKTRQPTSVPTIPQCDATPQWMEIPHERGKVIPLFSRDCRNNGMLFPLSHFPLSNYLLNGISFPVEVAIRSELNKKETSRPPLMS